MNDLLRIGAFARLCRVSVKTLRYYESEGLIGAGYVEPATSYRYYRVEQAARLTMITNLRAAGFSIAEIRLIVNADPRERDLVQSLADQRRRLVADREEIDARIRVLDALARAMEEAPKEPLSVIKLTAVGAQPVHAIRKIVPGLGAPMTQLFELAESRVAEAGARSPAAPFTVFHGEVEGQGLDVEVCIPIKADLANVIESRELPGCELACSLVYRGSYDKTETLKSRMTGWLSAGGLTAVGPLREIYHRFGADQEGYRLPMAVVAASASEFVTELVIPVGA